eukprot:673774-Pyramimonas_sp.AAC.1
MSPTWCDPWLGLGNGSPAAGESEPLARQRREAGLGCLLGRRMLLIYSLGSSAAVPMQSGHGDNNAGQAKCH